MIERYFNLESRYCKICLHFYPDSSLIDVHENAEVNSFFCKLEFQSSEAKQLCEDCLKKVCDAWKLINLCLEAQYLLQEISKAAKTGWQNEDLELSSKVLEHQKKFNSIRNVADIFEILAEDKNVLSNLDQECDIYEDEVNSDVSIKEERTPDDLKQEAKVEALDFNTLKADIESEHQEPDSTRDEIIPKRRKCIKRKKSEKKATRVTRQSTNKLSTISDDADSSEEEKLMKQDNVKQEKGVSKRKRTLRQTMEGIKKLVISEEEWREELRVAALSQKYQEASFKCAACVKHFRSNLTYQAHMRKHSPSAGAYSCALCSVRVGSGPRLAEHERAHRLRYACSRCPRRLRSRQTMLAHYRHDHEARALSCPHCPRTFKFAGTLQSHVSAIHDNEKVKCPHCPKYYKKPCLKSHILLLHAAQSDYQLSCDECGELFALKSKLEAHLLRRHRRGGHCCTYCGAILTSQHSLHEHVLRKHMRLDRSFKCLQCGKGFKVESDLKIHVNRLHLRKGVACPHCDKIYSCNAHLAKHVSRVHEHQKPPKDKICHICGKAFAEKRVLVCHMRVHTGEKPYRCGECEWSFAHYATLLTHVKIKHRGHKYRDILKRRAETRLKQADNA